MLTSMRYILLAALLIALSGAGAQAQTTGTILGSVTDDSGAVIPGVEVTITNEGQGTSNVVSTQADGTYYLPNVAAGVYTIRMETAGFSAQTVSNLRLDAGGVITYDAAMAVGAVTEVITVEAATPLVETSRGSLGATVENKRVLELPLVNREVFDLLDLTPGAQRMRNSNRAGGGDVTIAGGRTRAAGVFLDGVVNSRTGIGATITELSPPVDAIEEVRVEASAPTAELGRSSAGFMNATTKSGTNEFHGSGYWFLRNDALNARGWDARSKTKLRRNAVGGTIGGPIVKNRTFFFYNYDKTFQNIENLRVRNVGLPEWKTGDLSTMLQSNGRLRPVYDPLTSERRGGVTQFENNIIPRSRLDPVAQNAIGFVPNANRSAVDISNEGNWVQNIPRQLRRPSHTWRFDHKLNSEDSLTFRYNLFMPVNDDRVAPPDWGPADPNALSLPQRQQNILLSYTKLFSPTFFMKATGGFFRYRNDVQNANLNEDLASQIGLVGVGPDAFPRFNIGGNPGFGSIGASVSRRLFAFTNFEYTAHFTKVTGSHTFKFGLDFRKYQGSELGRQSASGVFDFSNTDTRGLNADGSVIGGTGADLGSFLLGQPNSARLQANPSFGRRSSYWAGFFQDDWRVNNKLTLNLGLRYEYELPFTEVADRVTGWDATLPLPAAGTNGIREGQLGRFFFAGQDGFPRNPVRPDKNNIGPRFGFAYKPGAGNKTVIRGGFAVMYGGNYDGNVLQTGSQGFGGAGNLGGGQVPLLKDGLPSNFLVIPDASELNANFGTRGTNFVQGRVDFVERDHITPYAYDYNLTLQHQVGEQLFEVRYYAKYAKRVNLRRMNLNQIHPDNLHRVGNLEFGSRANTQRLLKPFTQYGGSGQVRMNNPNFFNSDYQAVSFKTEKRFNQGLGYIFLYTFSRWYDNAPFVGENNASLGDHDWFQNINDFASEWSLSANHSPHRVVFSPVYELPFGNGKKVNLSGPANAILGGWQVSGIYTFQTGSPFGVTVLNGARDVKGDNSADATLYANLVGNPDHPSRGAPALGGRRGLLWTNEDAFESPAPFTLGNAGRKVPGTLGPGTPHIFNIALAKNIDITEGFRAQLRWETFNSFNTPEFNNPRDQVGQSGFGVVNAGNSHREMQFGLKLYF
jgi:hypothetical protein